MILLLLMSLLLGICYASDDPISYNGYKVIRVKVSSLKDSEKLHKIAATEQFWSDIPKKHADIMISPQNYEKIVQDLRTEGFVFTSKIENVEELMKLERKGSVTDRQGFGPSTKHPMDWINYHSIADIDAYFNYLAKTYPKLVSLETIGNSYEKRQMRVLKICKGGCGTSNKVAMYIDGGTHAREWISVAVVTFMIRQLVEVENSNTSDLINKLDWYFLPIVNPDGYEYTRSVDRLWRKSRSKVQGNSCIGTDTNRNWDYFFGSPGSSSNACDETYRGPKAFSEVENQNIKTFISARANKIKFLNSIHSYGQYILVPWGYTRAKYPTYTKIVNFANKANKDLKAVHGKTYSVGSISDMLYLASGSSLDWALGVAKIPYPISMELRDTGSYGFVLPPDQIVPTGQEVWAFHKNAAKQIITEFVK